MFLLLLLMSCLHGCLHAPILLARSFTSTVSSVSTENVRQATRVFRKPSKKGYVRIHTNLGDVNVELHCDIVPR